MMKLTINVRASNIAGGKEKDSHRCMIADAIHEQVPWARWIIVDAQSIRFSDTKTGVRHIYLTPPEAQKALLQFDRGKVVTPFKFTLRADEAMQRTMRARQPSAQSWSQMKAAKAAKAAKADAEPKAGRRKTKTPRNYRRMRTDGLRLG